MSRSLTQRLTAKIRIDPVKHCWIWTGGTLNGYGFIRWLGAGYYVRRLSMHLWRGMSLSDRRMVKHTCGIRLCINPDHLVFSDEPPPKVTGDPVADLLMLREQIMKRVRVDKKTGCWIWTGGTSLPNGKGYGQLGWGDRWHRANRLALFAWKGFRLESKNLACHECQRHGAAVDNTLCVNPDHLYVGDHSTNTLDWMSERAKSGRGAPTVPRQTRKSRFLVSAQKRLLRKYVKVGK